MASVKEKLSYCVDDYALLIKLVNVIYTNNSGYVTAIGNCVSQ